VAVDGPRGSVRVRDAVQADAVDMAEVHVASWRAAYGELLPPAVLDGLSVAQRARHWAHVLDPSSGDRVVVAEVDGRLVGFAHVGPARDGDVGPSTGQLGTLYLHPRVWGTGVGRAVHDAGLAHLADSGFDRAVLWMLSTNLRARAFYERQGWTRDGRIRVQQFGGAVVIDHRFARLLP
jgi:RimJ/RimL family protein N-acetyltransferase